MSNLIKRNDVLKAFGDWYEINGKTPSPKQAESIIGSVPGLVIPDEKLRYEDDIEGTPEVEISE